jgi:hypothetical protein
MLYKVFHCWVAINLSLVSLSLPTDWLTETDAYINTPSLPYNARCILHAVPNFPEPYPYPLRVKIDHVGPLLIMHCIMHITTPSHISKNAGVREWLG